MLHPQYSEKIYDVFRIPKVDAELNHFSGILEEEEEFEEDIEKWIYPRRKEVLSIYV